MDIIVGTAGHIDHGKTALVKSLTGIDTDRLPEEKLRGITIDLGFTEMESADLHFGVVDVPGHEKFVRNMLSGASGIDLVLLIIAADEGVMPQTREHFDICRLLGIGHGIVVLTKRDLVDAEMLELVGMEVSELVAGSFLEDAPVVAVSSRTGEGIGELKDALVKTARRVPVRADTSAACLCIDRCFSIKGFGAVVTGTLRSGVVNTSDELELQPVGKRVRVRGLQSHDRAVSSVRAGNRVALNLSGVDLSQLRRGMVLGEPGALRATQMIDAEVEVLPSAERPLRTRQRVRAHLGTDECRARVVVLNDGGEIAAGEKGFVQLRFEEPVTGIPGVRFVLRSYSPAVTFAGGIVLDPMPSKHRRRDAAAAVDFLRRLREADDGPETVSTFVDRAGVSGVNFEDLKALTGWRDEILRAAVDRSIAEGTVIDTRGRLLAAAPFANLCGVARDTIATHHRQSPMSLGIGRETLREKIFRHLDPEIMRAVVRALETGGDVVSEQDTIRLASHKTELTSVQKRVFDDLSRLYRTSGLAVPKTDDALALTAAGTGVEPGQVRAIYHMLLASGELVKVTDEFTFASAALSNVESTLKEFGGRVPDRLIDVPAFKELAGISRKYAIPLLEYFDREGVTRRAGDKRIVL